MKFKTGQQRSPAAPSESRQLRALIETLSDLLGDGAHSPHTIKRIEFVIEQMEKMGARAAGGLHENPGALVLYGNPPTVRTGDTVGVQVGPALGVVESLDYDRSKVPRGYYFHEFGKSDLLCLGTLDDGQRIVLIVSKRGDPLWGEA